MYEMNDNLLLYNAENFQLQDPILISGKPPFLQKMLI